MRDNFSTWTVYGQRQWHLIVLAATTILLYLFLAGPSVPTSYSPASRHSTQKHKFAYVTFLAPYTLAKGMVNHVDVNKEDHYLAGVRMLIYQLLHDPITRTTNNIPFVVMVTQEVPQEDRDRLEKDGALVIEVSPIKIDWIKPGRDRWAHVMDKLHVVELIQYEKVLLLDSDIVVVKPLDGVFEDPATDLSPNLGMADKVHDDEGPQPIEYIMAGNCGPSGIEHPYPAPRCDRINAGFVVLKPSIAMFDYYLTVANIEGRFPGSSPEQDLWNYVHDKKGNMPWKQIDPDWTVNTPIFSDYVNGIASFHEKYWRSARDLKLRDVLLRSRWKMEGYFDARDRLLS